jgi:hypothetical protein
MALTGRCPKTPDADLIDLTNSNLTNLRGLDSVRILYYYCTQFRDTVRTRPVNVRDRPPPRYRQC